MRSTKPGTVEISVVKGKGALPTFLLLFQRHFEKACPAVASPTSATLIAPVDHLGLLIPPNLLDEIDSIEVLYRRDT